MTDLKNNIRFYQVVSKGVVYELNIDQKTLFSLCPMENFAYYYGLN